MAAKQLKTAGRTKEDSKGIVRQTLNKIEIDKLQYREQVGGWIRNVTNACSAGSSMYKRLCDRKQLQKSNQLKYEKKVADFYKSKCTSDEVTEKDGANSSDCSSEENRDSGNENGVDVEELIAERPYTESPFKVESSEQLALWKTPEQRSKLEIETHRLAALSQMGLSFNFEKPTSQENVASFTSPTALVQRLQKVVEDKDKQIIILRRELVKIHKESSVLAEQISRKKAPDAAQLRRQNHLLKEQLERCLKENAVLKGFYMQSKNSTIKRMQQKEALDEKLFRSQRPRSTYSCSATSSSAGCSRYKVTPRSRSAGSYATARFSTLNQ